MEARSCRAMAGNATLSTVVSNAISNKPRHSTANAHQRRRPAIGGEGTGPVASGPISLPSGAVRALRIRRYRSASESTWWRALAILAVM